LRTLVSPGTLSIAAQAGTYTARFRGGT
jgi:hypothetical protein